MLKRNKQVVKYATLHFDVATFPMQFISMDLIGEFHPPTNRNHRYALTLLPTQDTCSKNTVRYLNRTCKIYKGYYQCQRRNKQVFY